MSTSDRTQEQQGTPPETGNWAAGLHALEGVPGGIPAPALLARMANEFFNALPRSSRLHLPQQPQQRCRRTLYSPGIPMRRCPVQLHLQFQVSCLA